MAGQGHELIFLTIEATTCQLRRSHCPPASIRQTTEEGNWK